MRLWTIKLVCFIVLCLILTGMQPIFTPQTVQAGESLAPDAQNEGFWYTVQRGDSWSRLSRRFDIPIRELQAANPRHIHFRRWLITGHRLWIPQPTTDCPENLDDFATEIMDRLNDGTSTADLETWLKNCDTLNADGISVAEYALRDVREVDVVVVIHAPDLAPFGVGRLLVYHGVDDIYSLARQAGQEGSIEVLAVGDLNQNGTRDLVWTDTTCGAHTCFSTLNVEQWNGDIYEDWIIGQPTLPSATYTLSDTFPSNAGPEIIVNGGSIGSVGAGPIRTHTETYSSPLGAPYQLWDSELDPSDCYYHHLLEANRIFDLADAPESGGYPGAVLQYDALLADAALIDCSFDDDPDILDKLKDFTRFRLVVANSIIGETADAITALDAISDPDILGAGALFLIEYDATDDLAASCAEVTTYAEANPGSWDYLVDWGYGNPPFFAEWLCNGSTIVTGIVWNDYCPVAGFFGQPNASCLAGMQQANGIWEAGEEGIPDVAVTLYQSTCAAIGTPFDVGFTNAVGWFEFDQLISGDYCVEIDASADGNPDILIPGSWSQPATGDGLGRIDVTLTPGQSAFFGANFGWDYQLD